MQHTQETINKMQDFINKGGSMSQIKNYFPYMGSFSDVDSRQAIDSFNVQRNNYYKALEKLFFFMINEWKSMRVATSTEGLLWQPTLCAKEGTDYYESEAPMFDTFEESENWIRDNCNMEESHA